MNKREKSDLVKLRVIYNEKVQESQVSTQLSLLDNIENMQIDILSSCRRGLCGSCRLKVISGQFEKSVFENGYVLSCESFLLSDAEVLIELR